MDTNKFRTYALTLRPRNGLDDKQLSTMTEWIRKRSDHYHIVTEKEGSAKHLHAAMYLKKDVTRSNLCTLLARLGKTLDLDSEECMVFRRGVRILYSNDFVTEYLDKDDNTEVVASSLPEMARLNSWYPPKPMPAGEKQVARHSKYYWELESLWKQHTGPYLEVNTPNARDFLFKMMYSERLIPVIKDDKTIFQTARHLVRWLKKAEESPLEIAPFEKEE